MPLHDWTRVPAGIFHHFHHAWISEIKRNINAHIQPDYYALAAKSSAGIGPPSLTYHAILHDDADASESFRSTDSLIAARPQTRFVATSSGAFFRRTKSAVVVRHTSDDRVVAVVEIVAPGNKAARRPFRAILNKTVRLLERKVHLLLIDPFPPTKRDPHGLHAAVWAEVKEGSEFCPPPDKPLTLVAYEADKIVTAFVEPVAVGDVLPNMPLFLEPGMHVPAPLEATYRAAFAATPLRWQKVLEPPS